MAAVATLSSISNDRACSKVDEVITPSDAIPKPHLSQSSVFLPSQWPQDLVLPDLFTSWCKPTPSAHPSYKQIKDTNETYIQEMMNLTPKQHARFVRADMPYFAAVWAPDAPADRVVTCADWLRWVFDFDDLFDEGVFRNDYEAGERLVKKLIEVSEGDLVLETCAREPLVAIYDSIWQRLKTHASPNVCQRYAATMEDYCMEVVYQDKSMAMHTSFTTETYLKMRRKTLGFYPCMALSEYMYDLDLPDEVIGSDVISELTLIAIDLCALHNDLLSFAKDREEQFEYNIVQTLQGVNGTVQDGFNAIGELIELLNRKWEDSIRSLPSWGDAIDIQVRQYITCMQNIVIANLNWSFRSERYFGKYNGFVRETRVIPGSLQAMFIAKSAERLATAASNIVDNS